MEIVMVFYIILAGVIIYVAGQITVKIVLDPVQELKRVIAEIAFKLIYYSHVYRIAPSEDTDTAGGGDQRNVDSDKLEQAADEYRKLASMLNAGYRLVPFYAIAKLLFFLPKEADLIEARNELLEMSEEIYAAPKSFVISERRKSIEKKLRII